MEQPKENKIKFSRFLMIQTIVLGLLFAADSFFGFFEQKYIY